MIVKYKGQLSDPPEWLKKEDEITEDFISNEEKEIKSLSRNIRDIKFCLLCIKELIKLGLSVSQAVEITANYVSETGWGTYFRAWNIGGVKINKVIALNIRNRNKRAYWYKAAGNINSGDENTVFYRAFESAEEFFSDWVFRFIPKPGSVSTIHRYRKTGEAFWNNNGEWFRELIAAEYKGPTTKKNPEPSVKSHEQIKLRMLILLCQYLLNISIDGDWGNKSKKACKDKQKELNIEENGLPTILTLEKLINQ